MAPLFDLIKAHLDQDLVFQEALRRGVVNHRALARQIIAENNLQTSEESILGAIRKYGSQLQVKPLENAKQVLGSAHLNMRSKVAIIRMNKTQDAQETLPCLFDLIDYSKGEILRIIHSDRAIKVIVDQVNLSDVQQRLPSRAIQEVWQNTTEIAVVLPAEADSTPGISAYIFTTLGIKGINVIDTFSGLPEVLLFVSEKDTLEAYESLERVIAQNKRPRRDPAGSTAASLDKTPGTLRQDRPVASNGNGSSGVYVESD